jgi:hypothetical protein
MSVAEKVSDVMSQLMQGILLPAISRDQAEKDEKAVSQ